MAEKPGGDTGTHTGDRDTDTDAGDTDVGPDSGVDSADPDTSDTDTAPLAGALHVAGTWKGEPFVVDCTEADGDTVFVRYWSDSLGNVAGTLGCYRAEGARPFVGVTFSSGREGEWTAPGAATWRLGDASGAWSEGAGDGVTTSWGLAFTTFARVDVETYSLAGTLSGEWTASDGGGNVTGTFDALMPCSGACP
ncbi:MAG: hypothetical protein Q8P18_03145 [Pseudomonadota bacterium]|nr:hypothetical protein [Pseudomonadota bacterium]